MMTSDIPLRQRLRQKPPMLGMFSIISSVEIVEMIGLAGFDAVILDLEHGPYGIQAVGPLILAARARNVVPIVRVRACDPALIGAALDAGAAGVMVPQVTTAKAAREIVAAARFAPEGRRGVNPYVRAGDFTAEPDWFEKTNRAIAVMAMIEGREGIDALPEILEVPNLDAVFLGPVDLSQSLGVGLQPEHPRVIEAVAGVVKAAAERGKATAVFAPGAAAARRWLERGVDFVAVSEDTAIISAAFRDLLAEVKRK